MTLIPFPIQRKSAGEAVDVILAVLVELAAMVSENETYDEVAAVEKKLVEIMGRAELVQRLIWQRQKSRIWEVK